MDMSTFDDRERAHEAKFIFDDELRFRIEARRNKLLGLWVAEKMGREDAEAYAVEVVAADFEEAGDEDVFRKISADLSAAGIDVPETELRAKMEALRAVARDQVASEG